MVLFSNVLAAALIAAMVLWIPFRARRQMRAMKALLATEPRAREQMYRLWIAESWAVAGVAAVYAWLQPRPAEVLPLGVPRVLGGTVLSNLEGSRMVGMAVGIGLGLTLSLVLGVLVARRVSLPTLGDFDGLIPRTLRERGLCALLALSAGFCEEIAWRGF